MKLPALLESKKGQAFVLGLLALVLKNVLGLSDEDVMKICGLVASYVLGQGVADHGKEAEKAKAPQP